MKNQYVGDISDYAKYIILKSLCGGGVSVDVCWMLTRGDDRTDGKRTAYLDNLEYRAYDPMIFDNLRNIVRSGCRNVAQIESAGLFPAHYFNQTEDVSSISDLLFFDPDNGFEVNSIPKGKSGSERYVFWDDVSSFYNGGHSLMVFQYFPRVNRDRYMFELSLKVRRNIGVGHTYHAYTKLVDLLIIPQIKHLNAIERAMSNLKISAGGLVSIIYKG